MAAGLPLQRPATALHRSAFPTCRLSQMVQAISANPRAGDAIILDAPNQEEVFRYYYHGDAPVYPLPAV